MDDIDREWQIYDRSLEAAGARLHHALRECGRAIGADLVRVLTRLRLLRRQ